MLSKLAIFPYRSPIFIESWNLEREWARPRDQGMMRLYIIMPLTVHSTPRLEMGQGTGPGTNGLHTHFPVPSPGPDPVPGPVPVPVCTGHTYVKFLHLCVSQEKRNNNYLFQSIRVGGTTLPALSE